ncbi:hypothetical protein HHI36_008827, partial [Cryptolaemus montrouzieri]
NIVFTSQKCSILGKNEIAEIDKSNIEWQCNECKQRGRRSVIVPSENSEDETEGDNMVETSYIFGNIINQLQKNHLKVTKDLAKFKNDIQASIHFLSNSFEAIKAENAKMKNLLERERQELGRANERIKL